MIRRGIPKPTIIAVQRSLIHIRINSDKTGSKQIARIVPLMALNRLLSSGFSKKQKLTNAAMILNNQTNSIAIRIEPKNKLCYGVKCKAPHTRKSRSISIF
jgi:hypothetical protein